MPLNRYISCMIMRFFLFYMSFHVSSIIIIPKAERSKYRWSCSNNDLYFFSLDFAPFIIFFTCRVIHYNHCHFTSEDLESLGTFEGWYFWNETNCLFPTIYTFSIDCKYTSVFHLLLHVAKCCNFVPFDWFMTWFTAIGCSSVNVKLVVFSKSLLRSRYTSTFLLNILYQ